MNVIISNLNSNRFVNLDIDVIKSITGEFTVDEIVQSFSNFFFNRMFLDITSVKDYTNVNVFKTLSMGLDVSKVILLLSDDNVVNSDFYISRLISMGIYNFARNEDELRYLYDNPNSYKDVAHLQKMDDMNIISDSDNSINDEHVNNYENNSVKVIGIKNFTSHAGATSLIYMLKKQLSKNYYAVAIEVNKRDFMFFNDKDMISCRNIELTNVLSRYKDANVILIDLNDLDLSTSHSLCNDVIYLMESSTLMINKNVMLDNRCFSKISDEKVVLNRSLLNEKDVRQLEFETGIKFFCVFPPMNDRIDNSDTLVPFLAKFGLYHKSN